MRISKLYMPAVTLAGALALAGCGGGSSTPANTGGGGGSLSIAAGGERTENGTVYRCTKTTGTCPFTRDADGDIVVAEDSGIETEPVKPPEPPEDTSDSNAKIANELRTANAALRTLSGDDDDDGSALKKATDYDDGATGEMSVIKAQGVSSAIQKSAQGVLDARQDLVDAVAEAKAKRMAAMDRVETLDDGATKNGLNELITEANAAIEAGEKLLNAKGRNSLQGFVAKYTGEGTTPAERANKLAETLNGFNLSDNAGTNPSRALTNLSNGAGRNALGDADEEHVFADGNTRTDSMMTFAEIFEGETKDIAVSNTVMAAISLKGFDGGDYEGGTLAARTDSDVPGTPIDDAEYLGIPGVAHCREECKVNGEGWYFVPDEKDDYFAPDGKGGYVPAQFVEWGMWMGGDADAPTIVRYIGQGRGSAELDIVEDTDYFLGDHDDLAEEATYTGAAAGLSSRETGTGDDKKTASGHFEASVSLTAKFGDAADASIEGRIRNFRDPSGDNGSHVNTDWRLDLKDTGDGGFDGIVSYEDGDFDRGTITGGWTAQAYGSGTGTAADAKRPDGIFGAFNADFSDGKASGVYHAD